MWMYRRPSCPDCPFSEGLGDTEINTRIQGVLAHGAYLNFGSDPVPLKERVESPWVSPLKLTFLYSFQFLLLKLCAFLRRISVGMRRPKRPWPRTSESSSPPSSPASHWYLLT
jgi:hypothetical protein